MKIKEKLRQFGILVIRLIWPARTKRGAHLGILILAVGLMIGATQAGTIRKLISGSIMGTEADAVSYDAVKGGPVNNPVAIAADPAGSGAKTVQQSSNGDAQNVVDLIDQSELIVRGTVKEVTDGFENGIPYTQVTVEVSETLRGQVGSEYSFRQFGLSKPRSTGNGKVYLGVSPDGWSKYAVGENAMLFLYKRASITGLQTTVGLGQGKVVFQGGNAISQAGNEGLFENVDVDAKLLNDKDKRLLATKKGAVNADGFLSFVRRAVKDKWIEGGKLRHAKK